MKKKNYKLGKLNYKAYLKKVGHGYEVGFFNGTKHIFAGNFISSKEAHAWYSQLNKDIKIFFGRYWSTDKTSKIFYNKFLSNHIYTNYYKFINKVTLKHNREYERALKIDIKKYGKIKQHWYPTEKIKLKAA